MTSLDAALREAQAASAMLTVRAARDKILVMMPCRSVDLSRYKFRTTTFDRHNSRNFHCTSSWQDVLRDLSWAPRVCSGKSYLHQTVASRDKGAIV